MATCAHCGKKGLFLHVDHRGHCPDCANGRLYALYDICMTPNMDEVYPIPHQLTEPQVDSMVREVVKNTLQELRRHAKYCETSLSPDFFYKHYDAAKELLLYLQRFEMIDSSIFAGDVPSEIDVQFRFAALKYEAEAWQHYYDSIVAKTKDLKTDRGKHNAIQRYLEAVNHYNERLGLDAKDLIQDHVAELKIIDSTI